MKTRIVVLTGLMIFTAASVFSAPTQNALPRLSQLLHTPNRQSPHTKKNHAQKPLAKKTANSALAWKQIGSTHYNNTANPGEPAIWTFYSRDTMMYDANGNQIVFKTSIANTGWILDSLTALDSSVYEGGRLVEYIQGPLGISENAAVGNRSTFAYPNVGKSFVETDYIWDVSSWMPKYKDSLVFSNANTIIKPDIPHSLSNTFNYDNLIGIFSYEFNETNSSWKFSEIDSLVPSQSNDTTLTFAGKSAYSGATDSLLDEKVILTFNSSSKTSANIDQTIIQHIDSLTGTYFDYSKEIISYDANGRQTGYQDFEWNATAKSMICMDKYFYFPDSHGNDSLSFDCYYVNGTSAWDTSYDDLAVRSYDNNGNNLVILWSSYNYTANSWNISAKDVNTFAQINSPVRYTAQPVIPRRISVASTPSCIIVTAPDITGLMLYNAQGRLIASVKQQIKGSISLDLSGDDVSVPPGVYLAKLLRGNKASSLRLSINR